MSSFDSVACDWDKNIINVKRSEAIANHLLEMIPVRSSMKAMEYGAGTGLLSFVLKDRFADIVLLDSSQEMIRVIQEKVADANIKNMRALWMDLEKEDFETQFDVIYSQMVFHHVNDIELLLKKFYTMVKKGGYLAIADLYTEDGSFHGEGFTGHKGFDANQLSEMVRSAGFRNTKHQTCYVMEKAVASGKIKEFPVFLLVASK